MALPGSPSALGCGTDRSLHLSTQASTGYKGLYRLPSGRVSARNQQRALALAYARQVHLVEMEAGEDEPASAEPEAEREAEPEVEFSAEDWAELEVGEDMCAEAHPAFSEPIDLVGSDVCVLAAAFAGCSGVGFQLMRPQTVGWRAEVRAARGGGKKAVEVEVFGSWLKLRDQRQIRPIVQVRCTPLEPPGAPTLSPPRSAPV